MSKGPAGDGRKCTGGDASMRGTVGNQPQEEAHSQMVRWKAAASSVCDRSQQKQSARAKGRRKKGWWETSAGTMPRATGK